MTAYHSPASVRSTKSTASSVETPSALIFYPGESLQPALAPGAFARTLATPLLGLLWLYKQWVSPALHAIGGPSCGCRFYPTCSDYCATAIRVHGPLIGVFYAVGRLIRCTPLHAGGVDFVPSRRALRPRCVRTVSARPTP